MNSQIKIFYINCWLSRDVGCFGCKIERKEDGQWASRRVQRGTRLPRLLPIYRFISLRLIYRRITHRHRSLLPSHSLPFPPLDTMTSLRHPRPPEQNNNLQRDRVHVATHHPIPLSNHPSPAMSNGHHPPPPPPASNVNVMQQTPTAPAAPLQRLAKANEVGPPRRYSFSD